MPARLEEVKHAKEEGIRFLTLHNPIEYIADENGAVKQAVLQVMELGEPDASGRRSPVPVEGKTEEIAVDSVILAIGQKLVQGDVSELELNERGNIAADADFFTTSIDGVFAIGDATNRGASIAIEAIGEADRCAKAVDAYLNGQQLDTRVPYISKRDEDTIDYSDREKKDRVNPKVLAPEVRNKNFDEVSLGFTEDEAKAEADRCLECGCREYYKCKLLNVAQRYDICPERFKGEMPQKYSHDENAFIERNTSKCILCGLCVRSCREVMKLSSIGLMGRGFKTDVSPAFSLPLDETNCNNCGLCVQLCPTGSLTEKFNLPKQVPLNEEYSEEFVEIDGKKSSVIVSRYNGKILRVIPNDEVSRNSGLSREELRALL